MYFEIAQKKPVNGTSSAANRPGPKVPGTTKNLVKPVSGSNKPTQRIVNGWPSQQVGAKKIQPSSNTNLAGSSQRNNASKNKISPPGKQPVKGWPSQQASSKKGLTTAGRPTTRTVQNNIFSKTPPASANKQLVKGWPSKQTGVKKRMVPSGSVSSRPSMQKTYSKIPASRQQVTGWNQRGKIQKTNKFPGGYQRTMLPGKHPSASSGGSSVKPVRRWGHYNKGGRILGASQPSFSPAQRNGYPPATTFKGNTSVYGNVNGPIQPVTQACTPCQEPASQIPTVAQQSNGSNNAPFSPVPQPASPMPGSVVTPEQQQTATKGCTTLSRFAFNSAELKPIHHSQLRELAIRIFREEINAVIATGHTDTSGTEDYNEALGARRAAAVVKELRKQLSVLKPNAHKNLFWKIDSKGETAPVSDNDTAANRRVHLCTRKLVAA